MVSVGFGAFTGMIVVLAAVTLPMLAVWGVVRLLSGLGWVLGRVGRGVSGGVGRISVFIRSELRDTLNLAGGILTAVVIAPLALVNVVIGRWSAAGHYGRALEDEVANSGLSLYRLAIGNPVQLLGLSALTAGIETRLPDVVHRVPTREASKRKKRSFSGYTVTGTLPSGGSGARLFLARPSKDKVIAFQASGHTDPGQVVIKSFALEEGSTLPQIVRESRALECASKMGLVLEHELEGSSFHYVMPYVPGDRLDDVTRRMHETAGDKGLEGRQLGQVLGFAADILHNLDRFHSGGLWHKDIKPSNIIVSGHKVHLVDLGLVTPLQSAMTLTTHGTEYYRDPEMVRLALGGVKVHEVEGAKFDIYSTGAVLFSLIENDFPAHGNLSRISKACPDALAMIVRRAMADMETRYSSAREMLEDVRVLMRARDPFSIRVADLPSMGGKVADSIPSQGKKAEGTPFMAQSATYQPRHTDEVRARTVSDREAPETNPADSIMGAGAPVRASRKSGRSVGSRVARALAAGLFFMTMLGIGAFALFGVRHARMSETATSTWPSGGHSVAVASETPVETHVMRLSPRGLTIETERHADALATPTTITRVESNSPKPDKRVNSRRRAIQKLPLWVQPFGRLETEEKVLVLRDMRASAKLFDMPAIRNTIVATEVDVLDPSSEGEDGNLERVLGGDARSVIGLGTPDEPEVVERLRDYLDRDERIGGILWLWSDENGPRHIALVDRPQTGGSAAVIR
ncbi:MAG: serine/threonine protein kinase [Planctomycetota bacterium]|jgi:serine/threonine protein kinase